jgi:hypothetical protein
MRDHCSGSGITNRTGGGQHLGNPIYYISKESLEAERVPLQNISSKTSRDWYQIIRSLPVSFTVLEMVNGEKVITICFGQFFMIF